MATRLAIQIASVVLALWTVGVLSGHGSWSHWYQTALPAALCLGGLGYGMGHILAHPARRRRQLPPSANRVHLPALPSGSPVSTIAKVPPTLPGK